MGTIFVDTIEPQSGTTLTVGESGQNTVITNNDIRANVLKDVGGNAVFTSDGSGSLSGIDSQFGSAMTLIRTETASSSASIEFNSTYITNAYKEYIFVWYDIHPATNAVKLQFDLSTDNGSSYSSNKYTGYFRAELSEGGSAGWGFTTNGAKAGTDPQPLSLSVGSDNDQVSAGYLHLFDPSNTTYVKQFFSRSHWSEASDYSTDGLAGGYFNITSAVNAIKFWFSSGNIDAGKIKLFGVK